MTEKAAECEHDYENPVRLGRAHYICKDCKDDITLALVLMAELKEEEE